MKRIGIWLLSLFLVSPVFACSTIDMSFDNRHLVAKNLDWPLREGLLIVHPRYVERQARADKKHRLPLRWRSVYGSVIFHGSDNDQPGPAADGMNEMGLSVMVMVLPNSEFPYLAGKRELNMALWSQYLLDNFQSVEEVLDHLNDYNLWAEPYHDQMLKFHLYLSDSSGRKAIVEYNRDQSVVYQDDQIKYRVLTNDNYQDDLAELGRFKAFGGTEALPGESDPLSRFVRAAAFKKRLPAIAEADAVGYAFTGLGLLAQSPGEKSTTQASMVFDLDNRQLYIRTINKPTVRMIDLNQFDFSTMRKAVIINLF